MSVSDTKNISDDIGTSSVTARVNKITKFQKLEIILSNITVEPLLILYVLQAFVSKLAVQNLNLEKACRVNLQFNETICDAMATRNSLMYNSTDEIAVQKLVASMNAWKAALHSFFPVILLLFLGSWSDRNKRRKPCMLLPVFGEIFISAGLLLCTYFFYELSMEWNGIVESIPMALTGSQFFMCMGAFSYVSEVSSVDTRTLRIGIVHVVIVGSATIGIAISGSLYQKIGFYGVFSITLITCTICLVYGLLRINENTNGDEIIEQKQKHVPFLKDFFNWKYVVETFCVVFKNGEKNRKWRISSILILVMCVGGSMNGEGEVMYLFLRYRFQWNEIDYSIFCIYTFTAHIIGSLIALMLSKYLKMDDALLGIFSCFSKIFSSMIYAFAPTSAIFYIGIIIDTFQGTAFIALRTMVSKLVPADELGQVNSLFGVTETMLPFIYGPMYSLLYRATINVLPGTFFLIGGMVNIPAAAIFLWFYTEHRKDAREDQKHITQKEGLL